MKDIIDRRAALGALAGVPAWGVPVVAMATPADPIFTAIERDRIAYVAFAASLNTIDVGRAAQEKRSRSHTSLLQNGSRLKLSAAMIFV